MLINKKVLIIITGSVAAYKALYLIRLLKKRKCDVNCVMTNSAKKFITPLAVSSLSGNKVYNELFHLTDELEMGHIKLAKIHDIILVAPCTANFISKVANGLADDLASTLILATKTPTYYFPAMNTHMWENSIIKKNIKVIKDSGQLVIKGDEGNLACGDNGYGRLMEPDKIITYLEKLLEKDKPIFKGIKALVTAGPTQEPLDPVRYISNHSTGIQGYAIAGELAKFGAEVCLISGPTALKAPNNLKSVFFVKTAEEMYKICKSNIPRDLFISVAAVTDWKSKKLFKRKIKKANDAPQLNLAENPDILKYVSMHQKRPKLVIGFAAETNSLEKNAKKKLLHKGCDLLIANKISDKEQVFGDKMNSVHIFDKNGLISKIKKMDKYAISKKILEDYVHPLLKNY